MQPVPLVGAHRKNYSDSAKVLSREDSQQGERKAMGVHLIPYHPVLCCFRTAVATPDSLCCCLIDAPLG